MVRRELRIVLAAIAVFAALGGLGIAIDGLVFNAEKPFRYGVIALIVAIAVLIFLLNPTPKDEA